MCGEMSKTLSFIESASNASHLGGVPRHVVLAAVGGCAKFFTSFMNRTRVYNMDTLLDLVQSRPAATPLLTVSNHMCTIDDPLMWGLKGLPIADPKLSRWTLAAEDICFTNHLFSYFFRLGEDRCSFSGPTEGEILLDTSVGRKCTEAEDLYHLFADIGKCLPIKRGAGIYQPHMNEALDVINRGEWLHMFPEGKLSQEEGPMRRLKWGAASLIARADVKPIVLPIAHNGFEKVLPENFWFGKRPPLPLFMKHISIVIGEPMVFDIDQLKLDAKAVTAKTISRSPTGNDGGASAFTGSGAPSQPAVRSDYSTCLHVDHLQGLTSEQELRRDFSPTPLDEFALNWMYAHMSESIRCVLQDLALKAKSINSIHA